MDWKEKTLKTYNASARALAEYFKGFGPRVVDIERAIELSGGNSRALEIGCGDGRDGAEIAERFDWYEGFDPSTGLLELARANLPHVSFKEADALSYEYPENLDVVYAFASLLHLPKEEVQIVLERVAKSLRAGGVFYISLKKRDMYTEEPKTDKFGERMFYFYTPELIQELAGDAYTCVHEDHQHIGNTDWFTIALKKH